MCTAIALNSPRLLLARTLDVEEERGQSIAICPRRCELRFRHMPGMRCHAAIIGAAVVIDGFPLFFDAGNEHGLCMAALNFPDGCRYHDAREGCDNIASFELIAWILSACATVADARAMLSRLNLCSDAFSPALPPTPLHFLLAGRDGTLVIESTPAGLQVYDDPAGVMTNSPPFPCQMQHLASFAHLTFSPAHNALGIQGAPIPAGSGAVGLPGDLSSPSRFVRAAFARAGSLCPKDAEPALHALELLSMVSVPMGCVRLSDGRCRSTQYACVIDAEKGVYAYRTYASGRVYAADLHSVPPDSHRIITLAMRRESGMTPARP